ncbi:MAG: EAL domain-containing protein, partial [Leptolyngbya sp. SIO4C1]|nr:EAL domain-containing protein [Leptolyngbya sp. SIO4C1]
MTINPKAATDESVAAAHQQAMAQIALLNSLILRVGEAPDVNSALQVVIQSVCQHQRWKYGEAWQLDPEAAVLRKNPAWYGAPTTTDSQSTAADLIRFKQFSENFTFAPGVGIPGRVWASRQPEWHVDVSQAPEAVFLRYKEAADCGIKAAFGIPLACHNQTIAVLVFFSDEAMPKNLQLIESIKTISIPISMLVQQRLAEQKLRDSEARFHAFMNHSPAVIFMKDNQGRFAYANRFLEQTFELAQGELIGKTDAHFLPEAVARRVHENDRLVLSTNKEWSLVEIVPTPDGVSRYWQVLKFPFIDQTEQQFVGGVAFDITPQKQFEKQLIEEKELAQVTLRSIGDAVITTNAVGQVQYLNPVAEALTGWTQAEANGRALSEIFNIVHETTREPAANPVERVLREKKVVGLANHTVLIARDGTERSIEDSAAPIQTDDGCTIGAVLVFHDVSETRHLTRQLSWQASHDMLTGLFNRREFEQRIAQAVENARSHGRTHVICYLDLDNFKVVNDTCGHAAGDRLLKQVSSLLSQHIRKTDTIARLGGDEFGLLLEYCQLDNASRIVYSLREKIRNLRFTHSGRVFSIGVSIGVTSITADTDSAALSLSNADAACYMAKRKGRNRVHIHQPDDSDLAHQRDETHWAAYITEALEKNQFCLYCQPIVPLSSADSAAKHYEILLRLRDKAGQLVSPGAFMPAAERYNLMPLIDRWVVQTLFSKQAAFCRQVWARSEQPLPSSSHLYSVNLSGASINDDEFIHFLKEQFSHYQIPPALICFEVTETAAIENLTKAAQLIGELRNLGCRFALDDFGSGMSSFAYLKTLPVDYLKIDGRFIRNLAENAVDTAMVTAIHQIAKVMNI